MAQDWKELYQSRIVTAEEAFKVIQDGDTIMPAHAAAEPQYLMQKLVDMRKQWERVYILQGLNIGTAPYAAEECWPNLCIKSFFYGGANRKALQEGRGETLPIHFYAQPVAMREKAVAVDIGFLQVTPPDEDGYVNMGTSCDQTRTIIDVSRVVIAQVNSKMPHLCGETKIHVSEIDYFVEYDEDIYELPFIDSSDPVAEAIGANIASLIKDGACLQMGQGKIPNAILPFLESKKDIGIHTEVFCDNLIPLVKKGVVNGAKKQIDQGKIVATFVQGTKDLYEFVDNNPMIKLMPVDYTNNTGIIAQNDNVVAINSAIEVDLMGQVVADSMGIVPFSGVGGQQDFIRGAEQSKHGVPIIALPATAKKGTVSRIVAVLKEGTPVTTTRNDVHYVVTEYGIADLFGKTINERAEALINIAAPQFREQLKKDFEDYQKRAGRIYF